MTKRWTEDDLKKLRPGMVVDEKKVIVSKVSPPTRKTTENQHKSPEQKLGDSTKTLLNPKAAMQALGRLKPGEMNKTEARYAQHLNTLKAAGEILWWDFEPLNLRIGDKCFLKIDFMILKANGALESHDVKGFMTDDALVKIRAAAERFPWPIKSVQWKKGEWEYREF